LSYQRQLATHTLYGRTSTRIGPEDKRSKVKVTGLRSVLRARLRRYLV